MPAKYFVTRETCPICGGQPSPVYQEAYTSPALRQYLQSFYELEQGAYEHYLEGANLIIVRCGSCELVYQQEIPNEEFMRILYEEWINEEKGFENAVSKRSPDFFGRISREHFALLKFFNRPATDLHFFDFGMGWGTWCKMAQGYGVHAYGAELSQARMAHAKKFGIQIVPFEDVPNHKFDVINSDQVFEHLSDPYSFLKKLVEGLNPGGVCHLFVPNGFDILRRLKRPDWNLPAEHPYSLNPIAPLEHINCYNQTSLIFLAKRVGLNPVELPTTFPMGGEPGITGIERIKSFVRPLKELVMPNPYPFRTTNLFFQKA